MAASTLRFERSGAKTQETKSGVPVYDGSASGFFEWEFRTLLKLQACADDEERKKLGARVCEGLTGEAFKCAMDIGLVELGKENGKTENTYFPSAVVRGQRAVQDWTAKAWSSE